MIYKRPKPTESNTADRLHTSVSFRDLNASVTQMILKEMLKIRVKDLREENINIRLYTQLTIKLNV